MKKSTLIVAALAAMLTVFSSCKKDDNINDPNTTACPATMTLTVAGSSGAQGSAQGRAEGIPSEMENDINSLTIMVFQGSNGDAILDESVYVPITSSTGAASFEITVPITQGAVRSVHVVANTDEADFAHVAKLSDLWDLPTKRALTTVHDGENLAMSGSTNFAALADNVSVAVQLQYVPSVVYFTFTPPAIEGSITSFVAEAVYLLNVKNETDYFTDLTAATLGSLSDNVTDFAHGLSTHINHAGAVSYPASSTYVGGLLYTGDINAMTHDNNYFYILENHNVAHPTTIVLEALVNGTKYYYPIVINGDQNVPAPVASRAGDGSFTVKRGQQYKVSAAINDVGGADPFEKIESASATITVTPADWPINANFIDQEFN